MKHRLLILAVFLLLGAIVNVAVAWGCALLFNVGTATKAGEAFELNYGVQEHRYTWRCFGYQRVERLYSWPPIADGLADRGPPKPNKPRVEMTGGWPMFTLTAVGFGEASWTVSETPDGWRGIELNGRVDRKEKAIELRRVRGTYLSWQALPLRPIWPGFAINTVFYAAVLWLLFAGPFVLRRRRRIRRGLCPKCAYDLRGTPSGATGCPECGAARIDA